ncbi:MAG: hypothetical protein F4078_00675, partial [Acidimicrobiia bacterium]|nr:hypothetical protein [Acidimicrobiia bacterium]
ELSRPELSRPELSRPELSRPELSTRTPAGTRVGTERWNSPSPGPPGPAPALPIRPASGML